MPAQETRGQDRYTSLDFTGTALLPVTEDQARGLFRSAITTYLPRSGSGAEVKDWEITDVSDRGGGTAIDFKGMMLLPVAEQDARKQAHELMQQAIGQIAEAPGATLKNWKVTNVRTAQPA